MKTAILFVPKGTPIEEVYVTVETFDCSLDSCVEDVVSALVWRQSQIDAGHSVKRRVHVLLVDDVVKAEQDFEKQLSELEVALDRTLFQTLSKGQVVEAWR